MGYRWKWIDEVCCENVKWMNRRAFMMIVIEDAVILMSRPRCYTDTTEGLKTYCKIEDDGNCLEIVS